MSENLERSIGRIEGRLGTFEGKLDTLISAISASEARADHAREQLNARLTVNENRLLALQAELHDVARKVDAIEPRVESMEPELADLRRLRVQGVTVIATLAFIGSILGVSLYSLKDRVFAFFGVSG